eukprot:1121614-Rhodomonas_salina.1
MGQVDTSLRLNEETGAMVVFDDSARDRMRRCLIRLTPDAADSDVHSTAKSRRVALHRTTSHLFSPSAMIADSPN